MTVYFVNWSSSGRRKRNPNNRPALLTLSARRWETPSSTDPSSADNQSSSDRELTLFSRILFPTTTALANARHTPTIFEVQAFRCFVAVRPQTNSQKGQGTMPALSIINYKIQITMKKIDIYTDGACSGNPGKGGYGFIITENGKRIHDGCGGFRHTTNNRMEILAVARALNFVNNELLKGRETDIKVTVYSDSQLVVNTLKLGWSRKTNSDLWNKVDEEIFELDLKGINCDFTKVKGHSGDYWNEMVDQLAVAAYAAPDATFDIDVVYENISVPKPAVKSPSLFEIQHPEEPTVEDIVLKGQSTPENRSIEVHLSNGTVVKISALYEGFEQYNCNRTEAAVTVDIARRFNPWLHGKKF